MTHLADMVSSAGEDHSNNDDPGSDEHGLATTETVTADSGEGRADHGADSVEGEDDTRHGTVVLDGVEDAVAVLAEHGVVRRHCEDG